MTPREAKEILLLYRPGTADAEDPQIIEAMGMAREDPDVARWFEQHCAFQKAMRARFREIEVPAHLKYAVLTGTKIKTTSSPSWLTWSRAPAWLAAAAAVAIFAGLASFWTRPRPTNNYQNFQSRMITTARVDYRMDIKTNDMGQVRRYLASQGAPSDYQLTPGLQKLALTGGGALRWRDKPVSMVCFDRGDNQMLFLFVMDRAAVKDPPPEKPEAIKQNQYLAVRWSQGDKAYLLAGPEEPDFLKKYL